MTWSAIGYQPDYNKATPGSDPGTVFYTEHATYGRWKMMHAKFSDDALVAGAAGRVVYLEKAEGGQVIVTDDVSASETAGANSVAGVLVGAVTIGNYCNVLVYGKFWCFKTAGDDDGADGDAVHGDGDGTAKSTAQDTAPTNTILGIAHAADEDVTDTFPDILVTIGGM